LKNERFENYIYWEPNRWPVLGILSKAAGAVPGQGLPP